MNIEYTTTRLGNLKVQTDDKNKVSGIEYKGEILKPTTRFWTSLCAKFGFNATIFKYFSHAEVFERISEKNSGGEVRITVEKNAKEANLLGVSNPLKAVANYDQLMETLGRHGAENINYANGIVTSRHSPRMEQRFSTVGDEFKAKFFLNTPIDGYGNPSSYLGFLRLVCSNGMMFLTRAFRSELKLGRGGEENCMPTVVRSLESFNNEDGYSALQSRIQDSAKSWASVYEAGSLRKILEKVNVEHELDLKAIPTTGTRLSNLFPNVAMFEKYHQTLGNPIFKAFESMTGDENAIYGYANMEALSMKRRRTLPVKCSIYDLINFATEIATHHAKPAAAALLSGWIGELVSNEYDLENTMTSHSEFADFHVNSTTEVEGKLGIN